MFDDYSALEEEAIREDAGRQANLRSIDRLETEARLALARLDGDSRHTTVYAGIIRRCAERRARLLGSSDSG